jgi:hypothetical protein
LSRFRDPKTTQFGQQKKIKARFQRLGGEMRTGKISGASFSPCSHAKQPPRRLIYLEPSSILRE